jgi:hypothetical protein
VKDWEEEFDKEFTPWIVDFLMVEQMKAFIEKILKVERQSVLDKVKLESKPMSKHFEETCRIELTRDKMNRGYNWAIDDLKALISKLKEEV